MKTSGFRCETKFGLLVFLGHPSVQRFLLRMSVLVVLEKKQLFSVVIFIWQAFPLAQVRYEGDTKNFDDYPETDWASVKKVSERQLAMFEDFWAGARNFFWEQDQRKAWSVIYSSTTSLFNSTNIWWLWRLLMMAMLTTMLFVLWETIKPEYLCYCEYLWIFRIS